jgi:hypothetical protein
MIRSKCNNIFLIQLQRTASGIVFLIFFLTISFQAYSTSYSSVNSNIIRAGWNSTTTWQSGIIPPTIGFASNSNVNITYGTPFQSIILGNSLTIDNNSNLTINASDTLIVKNFTVNSGSNVTIHGILIVTGNFVNNGGINDGSTNGRIIVLGNISNTGGSINNITAFVFGTYTVVGSGSYLQKTQTNFNSTYSSSTTMYKTVQQSSGIVSLPIELFSFSAQTLNNVNNVSWKTETETNNDYFTLEKSTDGYDWTEIYTCKGAGTTTIAQRYSYTDKESSNQIVYYRLKQTDFDDHYTYSSIVSVSQNAQKIHCTLYPNPTTGILHIAIAEDLQAFVRIEVVDAMGSVLFESSEYKAEIDLSNQPNGLYFIKVSTENQLIVKPIILSK